MLLLYFIIMLGLYERVGHSLAKNEHGKINHHRGWIKDISLSAYFGFLLFL